MKDFEKNSSGCIKFSGRNENWTKKISRGDCRENN